MHTVTAEEFAFLQRLKIKFAEGLLDLRITFQGHPTFEQFLEEDRRFEEAVNDPALSKPLVFNDLPA